MVTTTITDPAVKRTNNSWMNMKQRCNNPRRKCFKDYGGRGISYDPYWEKFTNFLQDMGVCPPNMSLERKDNNQNYTKANCVWATVKQQNRNRRSQIPIEWVGETLLICEWAERYDIDQKLLSARLIAGWPIEEALTKPPRQCVKLTKEEKLWRYRARDAVRRALKSGRLVKPTVCDQCNATGLLQAHHASYAVEDRLTVNWLCQPCHNRSH